MNLEPIPEYDEIERQSIAGSGVSRRPPLGERQETIDEHDLAVNTSPGNVGLRNLARLVGEMQVRTVNRLPIVLVAGFSGWGQPLFGTLNYWGGFEDLPSSLAAEDTVIIVRVGPFSSNMERACEIYSQLTNIRHGEGYSKRGRTPKRIPVHYGKGHPLPEEMLHDAQTWEAAVYGDLPSYWEWSATNRVNFICHSMGGTTMRYLVELLSGRHHAVHPNFPASNCQSWIKSIVTVGTPHKGTTITDVVTKLSPPDFLNHVTDFVFSASFKPPEQRFYDLQLDHWGFCRKSDESLSQMHSRLKDAVRFWWYSYHHGFYDNSTHGIQHDLELFAPTPSQQIIYFTMSFCATNEFPNDTLSGQDINTILAIFPLSRWWNFCGILGYIIALLLGILAKIPCAPRLRDYAQAFTKIANCHLRKLNYFSSLPLAGSQVPRPDVLAFLSVFAYAMGGYTTEDGSSPVPGFTTEQCQMNDGVVNTVSMNGPINGPIVDHTYPFSAPRSLRTGRYWHLGSNSTMDHADQIGVFTDENTYAEVEYMYLLLARLLARL